MVYRFMFGAVLLLVGALYTWLAYMEVAPHLASGNWVYYLGTALFLAAAIGAALAGINLVRAKRR